ncbi:aldose epimerase family protein [Amphibiibacter pelophylacis]|uniref:Aldose epimerase family protein n=1 Tax=Amphibiibacter pelophylacis TaxID=1799477 RepID=A0ACC6P499_9BURK
MTMVLSRVRRLTDEGAGPLFMLSNSLDMSVVISPWGATLRSWRVPDRYGRVADILLGYPSEKGWQENLHFMGATVGRWANRMSNARFSLDGRLFQVDRNEGNHLLHGGYTGFHRRLWSARIQDDTLVLGLTSPDGDGGFPGAVNVQLAYRLDDEGRLLLDYQASSDAPTPINLTAHPYFNLGGDGRDIRDHQLRIDAEQVLHTDKALIPTHQAPVAGSAFDFRSPAPIGARLSWLEPQLTLAGGFDHCYVLPGGRGDLREVAHVHEPSSGRSLTVLTTEPGLQFYSGNHLRLVPGRHGLYQAHAGFCLEAQAFPNQINSPDPVQAEAVVLRPGQHYRQQTCYWLQTL